MDEALREHVHGWLLKASHDLDSARKLATDPDAYLDTVVVCPLTSAAALRRLLGEIYADS